MLRRLRSAYQTAADAVPAEAAVEAGSLTTPQTAQGNAAVWATVRQVSVPTLFVGQLLATNLNVVTHTGEGIAGAFSYGGPLCTCLQPATYAFSVWAVIYSFLAAYCVYQTLPENRDAALVRATGWFACISFIFLAAWGALASAAPVPGKVGVQAALCVLLLLSFRASWLALVKVTKYEHVLRLAEVLCVAVPFSLLTAWLLLASLLNLSVLLLVTGETSLASTSTGSQDLCVAGVTLIFLCSAAVWGFSRGNPYAAAVAIWGLLGIAVANGDAGRTATARAATIQALLLAIGAVVATQCFQGPSLRWFGAGAEAGETQPLVSVVGKDADAASPPPASGLRARLRRWFS